MKAKVLVNVAGAERSLCPGDTVEGDTAIDLVRKGFAVPLRNERQGVSTFETATIPRKRLK